MYISIFIFYTVETVSHMYVSIFKKKIALEIFHVYAYKLDFLKKGQKKNSLYWLFVGLNQS